MLFQWLSYWSINTFINGYVTVNYGILIYFVVKPSSDGEGLGEEKINSMQFILS